MMYPAGSQSVHIRGLDRATCAWFAYRALCAECKKIDNLTYACLDGRREKLEEGHDS